MTDTNKAQSALDRIIVSLCLYLAECNPRCEREDGQINPTKDEINEALDTVRAALSPNAVVIPRQEFERVKYTLAGAYEYVNVNAFAGCPNALSYLNDVEQALAILEQYGETT
jgi:hypothetical protein